MRELKRKMFLTLFISFSVLVAVITGLSGYQSVLAAQDELRQSMLVIAEMTGEFLNPNELGPWSSHNKSEPDLGRLSLIYDNPAWIVSLDINHEPLQIYTSDTDQTDVRKITEETLDITGHHDPGSMNTDILASDSLCWYFVSSRSLILVDTQKIRAELLRELALSAAAALLFEAGLFVICRKATNWMIQPIEESMDKQKQFIADASHELKTPLAVILANAEAMEQDPSPRWLDNIKEESGRMNGLITSLLDLTRSEQRKPEISRIQFSHLVEKQCLMMEAVMFEKHLELTEAIEPDLFVLAEAAPLQQVCAILLDNASEHAQSLVRVRLFRQKKDIVLEVANDGKPIAPEEREKIFERFYRGDTSRNRQAGRYGLGLAIAKSIVESLQGKISAGEQDGLTAFTVTFRSA